MKYFCKALVKARKAILTIEEKTENRWFMHSRDKLQPILEYRYDLLFKARSIDNST